MPSSSAVASPSALAAAIKPALQKALGPVLADVWRTIDDPDNAGPRWLELYEAAGPGFEDAGYERLQHGYDYAPSRAVCSSDDPEAAAQGRPVTVPLAAGNPWFPQPRWTPPTLRVVAAPGVSVDAQPLCDAGVLDSARALYRMATQADERTLAQQAVRFELERRQDPLALPALGAPARPTPQTEGELALASTSMPRARRRRRRATRRRSPTPRT
jgi:hypothetical protein